MELGDTVRGVLNKLFSEAKLPMNISRLFLYRPTYFDSYYENFEILNDLERLFECDYIYVLSEFTFDDLWYEYEIRYKNIGRKFEVTKCILKYWELMREEDLKQAEDRMTPIMRLMSASIIPSVLHMLFENKK